MERPVQFYAELRRGGGGRYGERWFLRTTGLLGQLRLIRRLGALVRLTQWGILDNRDEHLQHLTRNPIVTEDIATVMINMNGSVCLPLFAFQNQIQQFDIEGDIDIIVRSIDPVFLLRYL